MSCSKCDEWLPAKDSDCHPADSASASFLPSYINRYTQGSNPLFTSSNSSSFRVPSLRECRPIVKGLGRLTLLSRERRQYSSSDWALLPGDRARLARPRRWNPPVILHQTLSARKVLGDGNIIGKLSNHHCKCARHLLECALDWASVPFCVRKSLLHSTYLHPGNQVTLIS